MAGLGTVVSEPLKSYFTRTLSSIVKADKKIQVTFVGDTDQAIYGGLGGAAKTRTELQNEFEVKFEEKKLDGCYRTTQRIIDYYSNFQIKKMKIRAVSDIKNENGCLIYNKTVNRADLFETIAYIVKRELSKGITENEICIVAPQWWLLFPLSQKIKELLPNVKFDAPDITPIKYEPMNVFYLISKLLFTEAGEKIGLRKRVANEIITILTEEYKMSISRAIDSYEVLKTVNAISINISENGIIFLQTAIKNFLSGIGIDLDAEKYLHKEGKSSYRILETPPLYRYAELTNGQFFTIPREILCVWSQGKKMPNSIENLKLKHFLARRLLLSKPYRARFSGKQMSRIVRFIHEKNHRRGMFEILSLELDGSKYLKKRKWNLLAEKVREILEYYQAKNQIAGYKMIIGETDLGRNEIIGIELQYYYN